MRYLIDTNVLSELVRPEPSPRVTGWFRRCPVEGLFVSVLTLGEIRKGVERVDLGPRRDRLEAWLERDIRNLFEGRILPVDSAVADRWGRLVATAKRSIPAIDSLLAATALEHSLRLATRNRADYVFPGPCAESEANPSPVVGWAGWDHLQSARGLGAAYVRLREESDNVPALGLGWERTSPATCVKRHQLPPPLRH